MRAAAHQNQRAVGSVRQLSPGSAHTVLQVQDVLTARRQCQKKVDAQGRYYCKTCYKQKRRRVCGSCHADLKACTCRLSLEHVCPEEGCQGRIPHLEKQDEKGRVTCQVCGERCYFSKLACGLCWEEKKEKLPLYQCYCIVGAAA